MTARAPGILVVGTFLSGSGMNPSYCEELSRRLESQGWSVARTSPRVGRVARLADMLWTTWTRRGAYGVAIVDVFSGHAFIWAEAVTLLLRRLRKPYVAVLRGGGLPEFAQRQPYRVRRLLRGAASVLAPSPYLRERLRDFHEDIELVPNALDVERYDIVSRTALRPRLLWVRAFHSTYNPTMAIEVLARIRRRFPDAQLTMVGPDKRDGTLEAVRRRARELGVVDHVAITGGIAKAELPARYASHDIFINTTDIDNTPLSVIEAMAAGLCVVSTSVGGIPYMLGDGRDSLLVPPRDPDAMATAIERLLTDSALVTTLTRNARSLVATSDWPAVLDRWDGVLRKAVA